MNYIQTVIAIIILFFLAQYVCLYYNFKEEYENRIKNFNLLYELTTPYALLVGALGSYLISKEYDFIIIGTITLLIVLIFYKTIFQRDQIIFTDYFKMALIGFIAFIVSFEVFPKSYSNGGSMEGTIKDTQGFYLNNLAYGLRNTKSGTYLFSYATPQRGDIIVFDLFKNTSNKILHEVVKEQNDSFKNQSYISFSKRVAALPGDKYFMKDERFYLHPHEGNEYIKEHYKGYVTLLINNELYIKDPYLKDFPKIQFITDDPVYKEFKTLSTNLFDSNITIVPQDHYFVLGDNRNVSNDSRLFGVIPFDWIVGKIIKILPEYKQKHNQKKDQNNENNRS